MPHMFKERIPPFSALASLAKITGNGKTVLLHAPYARALEQHIIIAGASSGEFAMSASSPKIGGGGYIIP